MRKFIFFSLTIALVVSACRTTRSVSSVTPGKLPPLEESFIFVPVKIYARPFLQKAEAMAPQSFTSKGWPAFESVSCDFQYKYRFVRSALQFSCINNKIQVNMTGNYQIAGSKSVCAFGRQVSPWISGSCGFAPENMRRVQISISSQLAFQPDGRIVSRSGVEKINPVDRCTVTLMNTDITSMITDSIRSSVNAFSSFLDQAVATLDYSTITKNIATITGRKITLGEYGSLKLNPSAIHVGKLNYSRDTIYFTAGFRCYPEITSDSMNYQVTRFLPPVSESNEAPGFRINANASYQYSFLDSLLSGFARQNPFELEGRQVRISSVNVRGLDNNKIELKFVFTGAYRGTLFLTGTPQLDINKQIISVPDLNYSLRSGDFLLNVGKAVYNKRILQTLRKKAVVNIDELLLKNRAAIDSKLSRPVTPYVNSLGNIQSLRVNGLVVNKDNLLMQIGATGLLSLSVKPAKM